MRTLDAPLLAAMNSKNYQPYFLIEITDLVTSQVILSEQPNGYELKDLELTFTVQTSIFLDLPFYRTKANLKRGALISGTPHYVTTSDFYIINSEWDGHFQTFQCHLFPRSSYTTAGDVDYQTIISGFCTHFGKIAIFENAGAAWKIYQFLPTGKALTLNNAQSFFTLLRQKYFIFATDDGNNYVRFYTGFSHPASADYAISGYHYEIDYNVDQRRQYLWRDEIGTVHKTAPSFITLAQPDAAVQYILSLCDLGSGVVLAGGGQDSHGQIYKSVDYGENWTLLHDTGGDYVYSIISPKAGIILAAGGYGGFIQRSTDDGVTWATVASFGDDTVQCLVDCGGGIIFASWNTAGPGQPQIWRSTDYGATWSWVVTLNCTGINCMVYAGNNFVMAGTSPNGYYAKGGSDGTGWGLYSTLWGETDIKSLIVLSDASILAGTAPGGKIYRTVNHGVQWYLKYTTGEKYLYTLNTLGFGVVLAGTGPVDGVGTNGCVFRSVDNGATWSKIATLPEYEIRSFITLGNGSVLVGTGDDVPDGGKIEQSLNCAADLDITHNLGFMPSTAVEPPAYFQLTPPKFDPFQVHLKYQSSDWITINLPEGKTFQIKCAQVTEILDLSKKFMPWRMEIIETPWLTNTAGGALPSTIERVAAYTPLVTTNFNNILDPSINNLQSFADAMDDHTHPASGGPAFPVGSVFLSVVATNPATLLGYGTWAAIAAGRVLVGLNGADSDFDTAEKTGGAKTIAASVQDHAAHTHSYSDVVNHTHPVNITDPTHQHNQRVINSGTAGTAGTQGASAVDTGAAGKDGLTSTGITATTSNPAGGVASGTTGNPSATLTHTGNATSVVQPYFVVYMWKRTA